MRPTEDDDEDDDEDEDGSTAASPGGRRPGRGRARLAGPGTTPRAARRRDGPRSRTGRRRPRLRPATRHALRTARTAPTPDGAPAAAPAAGRAGSPPAGDGAPRSGPRFGPALAAATAPAAGAGASAGGTASWDHGACGGDALRADAQRQPVVAEASPAPTGRWDEIVASGSTPAYRGPATPLAAERARQARIAVVGAVTERWAPEQAGPVHENWQLAAPVGPATDLWALGALLYRAVQGHAPYPEESAAELVQLVCAEPPAFAEECGPLRPVVESLLRQDPTERPDFEELRGWLRSLVRSAPEPEAGMDVVPLPSSAVDGTRLPVVRRRGELVRRRRAGSAEVVHGRHRHEASRGAARTRRARAAGARPHPPAADPARSWSAAVAYAVLFMPKAGRGNRTQPQGQGGARPPAAGPSPDRTAPAARPDAQPAAPERPAAADLGPGREPARTAMRCARTPKASRSPSTRPGSAARSMTSAKSATPTETSR